MTVPYLVSVTNWLRQMRLYLPSLPPFAELGNYSLNPCATLLPNYPCFPINTKHCRWLSQEKWSTHTRSIVDWKGDFVPSPYSTSISATLKMQVTPTLKTYPRLMAAYSVSGRVPRRDLAFVQFIDSHLSLSRGERWLFALAETSPLAPYAIRLRAPIGNSYSNRYSWSLPFVRCPLSSPLIHPLRHTLL